MTLKTYKLIQMAVAAVLGITFSQAIILRSFILPVIVLIVGSLALLLLRRRVKDIIADERDHAVGGSSALLSIQIYSWIAVAAMLAFYAYRDMNPAYEPIAMTLAFSTCFLMILYSVIFKYHDRFKYSKNKTVYIVLGILSMILLTIVGIRLLSGEDDWICQNGEWVKHGAPSFPAPQTQCK